MAAYGRIQALRLLLKGKLELDDSVVYAIYTCLQCGRCDVECKGKGMGLESSELLRLGRSLLSKSLLRKEKNDKV